MTAGHWRWLLLLLSAGVLVGGIIGLCLGGNTVPAVIGAVGTVVLGEVYGRQLRRKRMQLEALRAKRDEVPR